VYAFEAFLGFRRPREIWPVVRAQAEYTLQLDEMSSEAHICLGMAYALFDWRWRDAESHFQKAVERDSYSGAGHVWRALAVLIPMGKLAAATDELAKARELAPAPFLEEAEVLAQYFGEQYDAVLEHTARRAEAGPMPAWLQWVRSCALAGLGRTAEAIEQLQKLEQGDPERPRIVSTLGYVYGLAGEPDQAREALARLKQRRERGDYVSNYDLALVEAALGNRNEAVAVLQEALREREPWVVFLGVDPRMKLLQDNPRVAGFRGKILEFGEIPAVPNEPAG
ncbi:MAG: tetratricopeptide repeat protein, partial [Terracidiphilus sp.]